MIELILFYGLLSLAVFIGGAYSLHLYHKHTHRHENNPQGSASAH